MDSIYTALTWRDTHQHLASASPFVFSVRQRLLDKLEREEFTGQNVWIIAGLPTKKLRDEMVAKVGGELVPLIPTREEAHKRCEADERPEQWHNYIDKWFDQYDFEQRSQPNPNFGGEVMGKELLYRNAAVAAGPIDVENRTAHLFFRQPFFNEEGYFQFSILF
jgi:hypothetical protein